MSVWYIRQAPVICVMAPPIHLGAWSMALILWLPFDNVQSAGIYNTHHSFKSGAAFILGEYFNAWLYDC